MWGNILFHKTLLPVLLFDTAEKGGIGDVLTVQALKRLVAGAPGFVPVLGSTGYFKSASLISLALSCTRLVFVGPMRTSCFCRGDRASSDGSANL